MAKETRFGLLLGLIIIVGFGLLLSELSGKGNKSAAAPQEQQNDLYNKAPVVDNAAPHVSRTRQVQTESYARHAQGGGYDIVVSGDNATRGVEPGSAAMIDENVYNENAGLAQPLPPVQVPEDVVTRRNETPSPQTSQRIYKVKSGDTLTKIAVAMYGTGKEQMYKEILKANGPTLGDGHKLNIGQELVIPNIAPVAAEPIRDIVALQNSIDQAVDFSRQPSGVAAVDAGRRIYVVKRGDNLTKIARQMLRSSGKDAIQKILDANRDKITNQNNIPVGTELVIPG